jgi:hypothetical protein
LLEPPAESRGRRAQPITLTRDPGSQVVTLMDAAILIRDIEAFRQAWPVHQVVQRQ